MRPVPTPREAFTAVLRYETLLYAVEACCTRGMVTTRHKMLSVTSHYGATCVYHYSPTPWSYASRLHRRTQGTPVSAPVKSAHVTPRSKE